MLDQGVFKAALREQLKLRLAALSEPARKANSAAACSLIRRQKAWQEAASVLFYAPLAGELDIWPLINEAIEDGKLAALPQFEAQSYKACRVKDLGRDLCSGRYGIREPVRDCPPVALNQLDFVLVPGVAFDLHGRRLGRGKGYYDRLLAAVSGAKCGVAFDEQIVSHIPVEPHDSDVNCILTPTRWIEL